jgi:hypothetical protein
MTTVAWEYKIFTPGFIPGGLFWQFARREEVELFRPDLTPDERTKAWSLHNINELGKDGWELTHVEKDKYFFKRPI